MSIRNGLIIILFYIFHEIIGLPENCCNNYRNCERKYCYKKVNEGFLKENGFLEVKVIIFLSFLNLTSIKMPREVLEVLSPLLCLLFLSFYILFYEFQKFLCLQNLLRELDKKYEVLLIYFFLLFLLFLIFVNVKLRILEIYCDGKCLHEILLVIL